MTTIFNKIKDFFSKGKPEEKKKKVRLSLWDRFPNWTDYNNEKVRLLIERVEKNLANGEIQKAINRYEGFFKQYAENQDVHNRVAALYLEIGDKRRAGRHWYFKEELTEAEQECVSVFEKWCGNNVRTAKYVIYKDNFEFAKLDNYTKKKFRNLVEQAIDELGATPKFLQSYSRLFVKLDKQADTTAS